MLRARTKDLRLAKNKAEQLAEKNKALYAENKGFLDETVENMNWQRRHTRDNANSIF